jgi:hypothetical protein
VVGPGGGGGGTTSQQQVGAMNRLSLVVCQIARGAALA